MSPTSLPELDPVAFVDVDWADARLRELQQEIAELETRLTEVESEIVAIDDRTGGGAPADGDHAPFVRDVIDVLVQTRRATYEQTIEAGEQAAAEQILAATRAAEAMMAEARQELADLLRERTAAISAAPVDEDEPEILAEVDDSAGGHDDDHESAQPQAGAALEIDIAEATDGPIAVPAMEPVTEPVTVPAIRMVGPVDEVEAAAALGLTEPDEREFAEFWREEQARAEERSRRGFRVLDTLVPMLVLLVVLAVGLYLLAVVV